MPTEQQVLASLLQAFYGIRSERLLLEQLHYNLLYRCFVGLRTREFYTTAGDAGLHRQIQCQFQGKRHILYVATDHHIGHGRNIAWTLRAK